MKTASSPTSKSLPPHFIMPDGTDEFRAANGLGGRSIIKTIEVSPLQRMMSDRPFSSIKTRCTSSSPPLRPARKGRVAAK